MVIIALSFTVVREFSIAYEWTWKMMRTNKDSFEMKKTANRWRKNDANGLVIWLTMNEFSIELNWYAIPDNKIFDASCSKKKLQIKGGNNNERWSFPLYSTSVPISTEKSIAFHLWCGIYWMFFSLQVRLQVHLKTITLNDKNHKLHSHDM